MTLPHEGTEKATLEKPNSQGAQPKQKSRLAQLSLAALGVVFGDISTRPIYAIRECFHGEYGIDVSCHRADVEASSPWLNHHFYSLGCLFLKQGNDDVSTDCRQ
jgi:hypothetical protein